MRTALCLLLLTGSPAWAACYADYKAKQDDPLRLHYGVMEISEEACDIASATRDLATRLGDGWELLEVDSVFGPEGLEERRERAAEYFLRY
jgi:hypothetical protein